MKFRPFCLTCMVGLSSVASAETPPLPELWREFPDDTGMVFATEFRLFETAAFLISPAPTERKLAAALALLAGARDRRIGSQAGDVLKTLMLARVTADKRDPTEEERALLALFGAFSPFRSPPYLPTPPLPPAPPVFVAESHLPRLGTDEVQVDDGTAVALAQGTTVRIPQDDAALSLVVVLSWLPHCRPTDPKDWWDEGADAAKRWPAIQRRVEQVQRSCSKPCNVSPGVLVRVKRFVDASSSRCPEHRGARTRH